MWPGTCTPKCPRVCFTKQFSSPRALDRWASVYTNAVHAIMYTYTYVRVHASREAICRQVHLTTRLIGCDRRTPWRNPVSTLRSCSVKWQTTTTSLSATSTPVGHSPGCVGEVGRCEVSMSVCLHLIAKLKNKARAIFLPIRTGFQMFVQGSGRNSVISSRTAVNTFAASTSAQ